MTPIGEEIRKLRDAAGLTQQTLADQAGTSRAFLAMIEQGQRERMGADVLFKIAQALGVDCSHFAPWFTGDAEAAAERPTGKRK